MDLESYRLRVTGRVERLLELTYDELHCLPKVRRRAKLVCPGFFVDEATWAGAPIGEMLALAGVQEGATRMKATHDRRAAGAADPTRGWTVRSVPGAKEWRYSRNVG